MSWRSSDSWGGEIYPHSLWSWDKSSHLTRHQVRYCMECGVCTGSCPISNNRPGFSPRQIIKRALLEADTNYIKSRDVWACLGCARCSVRCPVEIDFPEFNRHYREEARQSGSGPVESHQGLLQTITRLQTQNVHQQRTAWAEKTGRFCEKGEYFYFVGCLPYYDIIFNQLEFSSLASARSVLRLLNMLGLNPVISNDERCCGHDALWSGDEGTFLDLARKNIEVIASSGARTVLFSCPEGFFTFSHYYPKYLGPLPFKVRHMSEFLAAELPTADLTFKPSVNGRITYQDPCRLGRWCGLYDTPRQLLALAPETQLVEMERHRENAVCCGTNAWIECSSCSKDIQVDRLREALRTGAQTLVTACPKCRIHLTCAQRASDLEVQITDLYTFLSSHLEGES